MIAKQTTSTEELIISHLPLAKSIAFKFKNCFPSFYDHEDVVGVAVKSLVSCVDSFDESKGKSFGAYSSIRINGSLIDEIRKNDQLSRSSRADFNLIQSTTLKMEKQLKRKPTDKEIKNKLNLNNSDYKKIIKNTKLFSFVDIDSSPNGCSESLPLRDTIPDNKHKQEQINLDRKEKLLILKSQIKSLNERDRKIINLYYFKELKLKDIAELINLSESRVSQILSKTLLLLKKIFRSNKLL